MLNGMSALQLLVAGFVFGFAFALGSMLANGIVGLFQKGHASPV